MAQRIRRIRGVSKATQSTLHEKRAKELLQLISNIEVEISELQDALKANLEELESEMKEGGIDKLTKGNATATFVRSAGKSQNIVDPKKFHSCVDEKDFYSAISVSITKAKELLGQKELDRITTTIPAKVGEEKLKITYGK